MGRRRQRSRTRLLEQLAAKCAQVEDVEAQLAAKCTQVEHVDAQLASKCAQFEQLQAQFAELRAQQPNDLGGRLRIKDTPSVPQPRMVQLRHLSGSSFSCVVSCTMPSVKTILDRYAAHKHIPAKQRSLLMLVGDEGILDERQCVNIEDTPELSIVHCGEPICPAIEFVTSGHEHGIALGELKMFNSRAGVVVQVEQDICPNADTVIALGSKVSLILRGTCMCLKVFEIVNKDQIDELNQVLKWSNEVWTTTHDIVMGNWEDCGFSNMTLPAGSVLRGHRPPRNDEQYGMVELFCLEHVRICTRLLFECLPHEVAMSDLNLERTEWNQPHIDIKGFTINEHLVQFPKPLGRAVTTGNVIPSPADALDVRKKTGLNVLAVQPANGSLERAPSSETLISKGCNLFFLQGHKEQVEATTLDGQITLDGMPFFSKDSESL